MEDFRDHEAKDFEVQPVPPWAAERAGDPDDFEDMYLYVVMTRDAMALAPDAYNWWLEQQLTGLKRDAMRAYYNQRD